MVALDRHSSKTPDDRVSTGLQALRLVVVFAILLDIVISVIAQAHGDTRLGPRGPLTIVEMILVVAAAIAVLWQRHRLAIAFSSACAVLFCLVASGADVWLLIIIPVMAGATARPRRLAMVIGALAAYVVAFGLGAEYRHPGGGWSAALNSLGLAAGGLGTGLIARALLKAHSARMARLTAYGQQNGEIRAVERARLADELQTIVTDGIATVQHQIDSTPPAATAAELRQLLTSVDQQSRGLLTELRALLDLLRREPVAEPAPSTERRSSSRWRIEPLTTRHVRIAGATILVLLAGRDILEHFGGVADADLMVRALGLLACAVAIWRPTIGAIVASATLALAVVQHPDRPWDGIAVALLGLVGTARVGARRIYLVLGPLVGYGLIVTVAGRPDPVTLVTLGYAIIISVALGLAARHFHQDRMIADRQLGTLVDERERIGADERAAVARELHDVVAHQLSLSTLHIMATSLSGDATTLAATAAKVRLSTIAARDELTTLLHAMRRPESDRERPAPLVTPTVCATALTGQLAENGFRLMVDIDPAADRLDAATQRTLTRIMQEASTNILRYAPAGATGRCTIALDPNRVSMTISSPLGNAESRSDLSLGWGLRGIRERVDLTHGTFTAGPRRGQWAIQVTLPQTAVRSEAAMVASSPLVRRPPTLSMGGARPGRGE